MTKQPSPKIYSTILDMYLVVPADHLTKVKYVCMFNVEWMKIMGLWNFPKTLLSQFLFIEEYQFRSTFFVIDIL